MVSAKKDQIGTIKMSGDFFRRIQDLLFFHLELQSPEDIAKTMAQIKNNSIEDAHGFNLETILMLNIECEKVFSSEENMEPREIVFEVPDDYKPSSKNVIIVEEDEEDDEDLEDDSKTST